jgi:hypothetical protein
MSTRIILFFLFWFIVVDSGMPYKSLDQAAYFNIHKKELESKGVNVAEWNRASKGKKLPKKVKKHANHGIPGAL